ncbi:hypothetical protein [Pseudoalteromonas rubra]|uniref:Pesticidal crystal protein N-terminal domain-containing protein n=1 Tax=Pseudoalteromonas rubra TaxID=43658 RepID=A0A0U3HKG3_9GAMM|nr:hypothetical protein [Pseudoalteromonas rubra]ALU41721.1 hypothetical protein AT705_01535 [Pseudoalteromonas rubra]
MLMQDDNEKPEGPEPDFDGQGPEFELKVDGQVMLLGAAPEGEVEQKFEDMARGLALAGISAIPYVGSALSAIIGVLTERKLDIWAEIKERVYDAIHRSILEANLNDIKGHYNGVTEVFRQANDFRGGQRFNKLNNLTDTFVEKFESIQSSLKKGDSDEVDGEAIFYALPYIVPFCALELANRNMVIRASWWHDLLNRNVHKKHHEDRKNEFVAFITLSAWQSLQWRLGQIELKDMTQNPNNASAFYRYVDNFTGKEIKGTGPFNPISNPDAPIFKEVAAYHEEVKAETVNFIIEHSVGFVKDWGVPQKAEEWDPSPPSPFWSWIKWLLGWK